MNPHDHCKMRNSTRNFGTQLINVEFTCGFVTDVPFTVNWPAAASENHGLAAAQWERLQAGAARMAKISAELS